MLRGRYLKVLGVTGAGTALLVSGIFGTAANASPLTAKQAAAKYGADGVNLVSSATNCGDGVANLPAGGRAMTAADFAALGVSIPSTGSPLTTPGTRWVVPRCAHLSAVQNPGGRADGSTSTASPQIGARAAASAQMGGSANWTGFQSNGGGPYSDATTEWTIPSSFPTPPGDTYESSWAGLGSGASDSNALFQAGTETIVNTSDGVSNYAWWEFYPWNTAQKITNLSIRSGSVNYAEVSHTGYGQGKVQMCTEPPGQSSFTCTSFGVTWGTAYTIGSSQFECIAERTEVNGVYTRLTISLACSSTTARAILVAGRASATSTGSTGIWPRPRRPASAAQPRGPPKPELSTIQTTSRSTGMATAGRSLLMIADTHLVLADRWTRRPCTSRTSASSAWPCRCGTCKKRRRTRTCERQCGMTEPAAASTGMPPTSSPPTSRVPPGSSRGLGTLPPGGCSGQAEGQGRNWSRTAALNLSANLLMSAGGRSLPPCPAWCISGRSACSAE
jgi:hypothetical protein